MSETIVVAIISFCGSLFGILTSNKLSNYRIQKLEEEVKKHNSVIDRMYKAEAKIEENKKDIDEIKARFKNDV